MKKKSDSQQLRQLLKKEAAIPKAVSALIECLSATKSYQQDGKLVHVADHATRQKAAQTILEFASAKPKASAKDAEPTSKLSEKEREEEVRRILGVE